MSEIKKNNVMVMFAYMNAVNTSVIKSMNKRAHHHIYPSVIQKILWQSTNLNMKTF